MERNNKERPLCNLCFQVRWVGAHKKENTQTSENGSQILPEGSSAEDLHFTRSQQFRLSSQQQTPRQTCCHHLLDPHNFTPVCQWQSANEAFKCSVNIRIFRGYKSYMNCGATRWLVLCPRGALYHLLSHTRSLPSKVNPDKGVFSTGYSWFQQAVKEAEGSVNGSAVNVIHGSFSVFAEAFVSSWWMLCQHLLRF